MLENNTTFMTIFHLFTALVAGRVVGKWIVSKVIDVK